jgi:hypothetical protein
MQMTKGTTREEQFCKLYRKRNNGSWYRTAVRSLIADLKAERDRKA